MASGSKKVIYAALIGNALIAVTKFVAAVLTRSSAMFSEGIHSVVDTGNQVLLLHGLRRSKKPPDEQFPFGHGKEIYFWSFVVAILIFAVGAGISVYEGVRHLLHPVPVENPTVNCFSRGGSSRRSRAATAPSGRSSAGRTRRCSSCCSRTRRPCWV
jgi:cation diffusion facilitator family transporter